jgi:hypothetical protein
VSTNGAGARRIVWTKFIDFAQYIAVDSGLWIFVLEGAVALALLVFIVWWTLPGKSSQREDPPR